MCTEYVLLYLFYFKIYSSQIYLKNLYSVILASTASWTFLYLLHTTCSHGVPTPITITWLTMIEENLAFQRLFEPKWNPKRQRIRSGFLGSWQTEQIMQSINEGKCISHVLGFDQQGQERKPSQSYKLLLLPLNILFWGIISV